MRQSGFTLIELMVAMALSLVLFDANLPLPLTFGGINLNKPGLGAFARRAGIIFLRRSDDPVDEGALIFFVLLLTLIITLYDRYRPIRTAVYERQPTSAEA